MTELLRSDFQTLAAEDFTCISIYMPAEKAGAETRKNSIRFKNLIQQAEDKVANLEAESKLNDALKTAKGYIENYDFWQHQDYGLAFFISSSGIKYYRLPHTFEETVKVGDRFYLKPLLPILTNDGKFYLLALSQNEVRFFLGSHYGINEIKLPEDVPPSLAEALKYDDPEKQQQYHSGDAGGSPIYHGQGVGTTDNKDEIKRFFQQIDKGLNSVLQEEQTPLILAGVEFLLPIYHETNSYNNLIKEGITGNPENVSASDLHQQAWSIIEPHFAADQQSAMERYYQLSGTGEASSQLESIVASAANGQVDTLFVSSNANYWGKYSHQDNRVEVTSPETEGSIDLIDFAVTQTYLQKGNVYIIDCDKMPKDSEIVATFRFPLYIEPNKATA